ncbi:MAG: hypothetical protein HUJ16_10425 [Kangiella sp.]|nr:hypothetical protein [Kangiella sp.]
MNITVINRFARKFLTKYKQIIEMSNVRMNGTLTFIDEGNSAFKLSQPIELINVPLRGNGRKKRFLYIFISCQGEKQDEGITRYTTRVSYAQPKAMAEPKLINLVKGMHYDFCTVGQTLHPIYHMQHDIETLREHISGDGNFEIVNDEYINQYKSMSNIRGLRIPTSHVDVFSILLMILSDHIIDSDDDSRVKKYRELLEFTSTELPVKTLINKESGLLEASLLNDSNHNHHSLNWYCHIRQS